jgi:hypothetical protein
MKISRQVGTISEILNVFINDATVSTGAGLANIVASTVSFSWFRSDMSAVSTGTATTGTMGTYTVSSFVQCNSTGALGWYQFMPPNGMFVSGRSAALHIYGAPNMAPLPIEVELTKTDNQTYMSSQNLSTNALVNVNLVLGSTPVTTAAGVLATTWDLSRTANLTSTVALTGTTISTNQFVNVNQVLGSTPVTSAAGVLKADFATIYGTAPVTTAAGIFATVLDLGRTANPTSTVAFTGTTISGSQNVSTIVDKANFTLAAAYDPSKTAAQAGDAMTLTGGERNSVADAFLGRNVSGGSSSGRLVKESLYVLRNKVDAGAGIVYQTDDTTSSWAFAVSTVPGNPIQVITPI